MGALRWNPGCLTQTNRNVSLWSKAKTNDLFMILIMSNYQGCTVAVDRTDRTDARFPDKMQRCWAFCVAWAITQIQSQQMHQRTHTNIHARIDLSRGAAVQVDVGPSWRRFDHAIVCCLGLHLWEGLSLEWRGSLFEGNSILIKLMFGIFLYNFIGLQR